MAAITVVADTAACTSIMAQSPAVPPTVTVLITAVTFVPALTATIGQSTAMAPTARAAATLASAARTDGPIPASTVSELQQRVQAHKLSKLYTTHSGTHGASLLFVQSDLMYYVTLLQQKDLWCVVKITNEAPAECPYSDFVKQTRTVMDPELQRIRLEVQKKRSKCQTAVQQEKLRGLKVDLDIQCQQQVRTQKRQKVARMEVEALDVGRRAVRARVDELQRQICELEAQVNTPFNSQPCCC